MGHSSFSKKERLAAKQTLQSMQRPPLQSSTHCGMDSAPHIGAFGQNTSSSPRLLARVSGIATLVIDSSSFLAVIPIIIRLCLLCRPISNNPPLTKGGKFSNTHTHTHTPMIPLVCKVQAKIPIELLTNICLTLFYMAKVLERTTQSTSFLVAQARAMAQQETITNGSVLRMMDSPQPLHQAEAQPEQQQDDRTSSSSSFSVAATPTNLPPTIHRIIVPDRSIQGGLDWKFDANPRNVKLHDILTPDEYTNTITRINDTIRTARATSVDAALLATGPLMVPLAVWGVRHKRQVKQRKKLLKQFHAMHPHLLMQWDQSLPQSRLTIQRRVTTTLATPARANEVLSALSGEQDAIV